MELNQIVAAKLEAAFDEDFCGSYGIGYRDALKAFALALQGTIPNGLLVDGLAAAIDDFSDTYGADFEDDGQPSEMQEWHDFDPDC